MDNLNEQEFQAFKEGLIRKCFIEDLNTGPLSEGAYDPETVRDSIEFGNERVVITDTHVLSTFDLSKMEYEMAWRLNQTVAAAAHFDLVPVVLDGDLSHIEVRADFKNGSNPVTRLEDVEHGMMLTINGEDFGYVREAHNYCGVLLIETDKYVLSTIDITQKIAAEIAKDRDPSLRRPLYPSHWMDSQDAGGIRDDNSCHNHGR